MEVKAGAKPTQYPFAEWNHGMEESWGLTGPQFLAAYWAAICVTIGVIALVVLRARGSGKSVSGYDNELDCYELAMLVAGPRRVVEAAVAGLISRSAVRVSREGVGYPTGGDPSNSIEAFVLGKIGRSHRLTAAGDLGFAKADVGGRLTARLVARGLYVDPWSLLKARRTHWLMLCVAFVGFARLTNGIVLGRPVLLLVMSLAVTFPIWAATALITIAKTRPRATAFGRLAVQRARGMAPRGPRQAWGHVDPLAVVSVALAGMVAYPDAGVAGAFIPLRGSSMSHVPDTDSCGGITSGCGSGDSGSACGG